MHNLVWTLSTLLGISLVISVSAQDNRYALPTPHGMFVGSRETFDYNSPESGRPVNVNYYAFKGIQYATAERWEESKLRELNGSETVTATQSGSLCPQWSGAGNRPVGTEECLFLNVYTPTVPGGGRQGGMGVGTSTSVAQLPVMVFFHPGGYMVGSGDMAGPRKLMRSRKVLLVTVNYRLGVLGYLSTGDETLPGNLGALDQITALEWVKRYIRFFGGNPNRVTVFGNSAGAASVHLLLLSPRAIGLFHGAIIQSGNALCDWAVESNPAEYAEAFAEKLSCSGDHEAMKECLQGKTVDELVEAQQGLVELSFFPIRTAPVVDEWRGDEAFLPHPPEEMMDAGAFAQVPILTGLVQDEGLMFFADIALTVGAEKFNDQEYFKNELLPQILTSVLDNDDETGVVAEAAYNQYFKEDDDEDSETSNAKTRVRGTNDLLGDITMNACHRNFLEKLVASNISAYSYLFTHRKMSSPNVNSKNLQKLREAKIDHPILDTAVSHCDELFYIFEPFNFLPGNLQQRMSQEDERVADTMIKIWTGFATSGNPSNGLPQLQRGTPWRPVRDDNIEYYNIPANRTVEFRKGESAFWLRTVPYLRELGANISELETFYTMFWIVLGLFLLFLFLTLILGFILWKQRSGRSVNM